MFVYIDKTLQNTNQVQKAVSHNETENPIFITHLQYTQPWILPIHYPRVP